MSIPNELRPDLARIASWIAPGTRVLDLGCGDGELLAHLHEHKQVSGYGVEIDMAGVIGCVARGVNVIQRDLESGLAGFEANSFDYVVLSLTIQSMRHVKAIIDEMLRVGRTGIVTFPNFGYWENRYQLALGRMPVSETIPYQWYNTPNIHLCTLNDFDALLSSHGARITSQMVMHQGQRITFLPNLLGSLALVRFEHQ
ncbi:methionine biosynthesis protein MetW [Chitinimonas sp. BJB300]|uniref:methionine biosynthesis protein MetW n=1 Tax=Chitinimonas sp. BJB300 TaxID=1559339 RepID=UPI000C119298|nr:methionine biosynthesis protein MetW [Chitinimonas sp. BJB300]PHV11409.1 methionine biosynthesis protein MetW [Chitinimonas sp. BJB300]TSJ91007.1 methionine biosynthesis protein MetW [Chitinimonas sp. BJB300]